jgi:hypothetical protein
MSASYRAYATAAALGLLTLGVVWRLGSYIKPESVVLPAPPPAPPSTIRDLQPSRWLEAAPITSDAFTKPQAQKPTLPNLNSAAASFLKDINGRWTGSGIVAIIDAKRVRGHIGDQASKDLYPIVVRDIGSNMLVADFGNSRFIIMRRDEGLAVAGATLQAPVELRKN